jgi:hypothetical protein
MDQEGYLGTIERCPVRARPAGVGVTAGLLVALAILPGCKVQSQLRVAHDSATDFARFRSFNFVPMAGLRAGTSTRLSQQVRRAVVRELQQRGYVRELYYPDLLVNFADNLSRKSAAEDYYGFRYYGAWEDYGDPDGGEPAGYLPGTVSVDLLDASRMQLIWEGVAIAEIPTRESEARDAAVPLAITKLFQHFPLQQSGQMP